MNTTLISAIMLACSMSEADAQTELKSAVNNLHSWLDQGKELTEQTGYGYSYIEEELNNLGLDYDYAMSMAEEVLSTYEPSTEVQDYHALCEKMKPIKEKYPRLFYVEDDELRQVWFSFDLHKGDSTDAYRADVINLKDDLLTLGYDIEISHYRTMGGWTTFTIDVLKAEEEEQCA